jgi:hypothetical protein
MAILGTEYPKNFEVVPERIKLWHKILEGCDYHEGERALIKLLSEPRPFPPVVGEICEEIRAERHAKLREQRRLELEAAERKALPAPEEISEEKKQENLAILKKLSEDIARKKAMRQ